MSVAETLNGRFVTLRNVKNSDAEFILSLRCDDKKNQYIHAVDNDVNKEVEWIINQQGRDGDYFFTIINHRFELVGNISLYNVNLERKEAELGRWISKGEAVENLESVIILHDFAFQNLGLTKVYTKTMQDNKKVVSFWKRFGGHGVENYVIDGVRYYYNIIDDKEWECIKSKFNVLLGVL